MNSGMLIWLISAVIALIFCVRIGNRKGRTGLGWVMGLLLGWIGLIIMLIVPKTFDAKVRDERERERIRQAASTAPEENW